MAPFADGLWREVSARWDDLRGLIGFSDTLAALPPWLAPPLAIASLLALVALAGMSLAAMGLLLTTLLAAHLLLQQVFGLSIGFA
jgi:hypothetical protein